MTSCSDDDDKSGNGPDSPAIEVGDLSGKHFYCLNPKAPSSSFLRSDMDEFLSFIDASAVSYQWVYRQDIGVIANGSYEIADGYITLDLTRVSVDDARSDDGMYWPSGSGFVDGERKVVVYEILSKRTDSEGSVTLKLKDTKGNVSEWEEY